MRLAGSLVHEFHLFDDFRSSLMRDLLASDGMLRRVCIAGCKSLIYTRATASARLDTDDLVVRAQLRDRS